MTTYELILFFGKTGQARTTIQADDYESAIAIAYKKYSNKRITKIELITSPVFRVMK